VAAVQEIGVAGLHVCGVDRHALSPRLLQVEEARRTI
jgi:hypothetical protein